jgi:hypothetical protein
LNLRVGNLRNCVAYTGTHAGPTRTRRQWSGIVASTNESLRRFTSPKAPRWQAFWLRDSSWPRRSIGVLAAWGVAEGDVSGAEGKFANLQVGDVFGQLLPRSVEAGEVGDERCVQLSHPRP